MNIKLYTSKPATLYPEYRSLSVPTDKTPRQEPGKTNGNYDKLTIKWSLSTADEASFARILARETAVKASEGASQERVNALQKQVASGTYKPDARQIAEHMLGYH